MCLGDVWCSAILVIAAFLLIFAGYAILQSKGDRAQYFKRHRRPSAETIRKRAFEYHLGKTFDAQPDQTMPPNLSRDYLEREFRRFLAVLALNPGHRYYLGSPLITYWVAFVGQHQIYANLCEALLGPGGSIRHDYTNSVSNGMLDESCARFSKDYAKAFGSAPDKSFWPESVTDASTKKSREFLILSADFAPIRKTLKKDGEMTALDTRGSKGR